MEVTVHQSNAIGAEHQATTLLRLQIIALATRLEFAALDYQYQGQSRQMKPGADAWFALTLLASHHELANCLIAAQDRCAEQGIDIIQFKHPGMEE